MLPDLNLQVHYTNGNFTTGLMGNFKSLQPREYTTVNKVNYKTGEKVSSMAIATFGQYKKGKFTIKGNAMLGQNQAEMMMQGGYVRNSLNTITGYETYSTSKAFTSWLNLTYGEKVRFGIYGGYQQNLGFKDDLNNLRAGVYKFYGRSDDVSSIWRLSPSVSYFAGRMALQLEGEITSVKYGTVDLSDMGKVINGSWLTNYRMELSVSFFF
ncbi:MAG: hypothetical protein HC830_07540 [Bacteroidetes bacterium]|nr:hypothetical protein [Bacteroidota bacterium]